MANRVFGVVATGVGFWMLVVAEGYAPLLIGGLVVISMGIGFLIYGDGK